MEHVALVALVLLLVFFEESMLLVVFGACAAIACFGSPTAQHPAQTCCAKFESGVSSVMNYIHFNGFWYCKVAKVSIIDLRIFYRDPF